MGTLGGGNHFIEVVADETGRIWLMLHSGSRYIGKFTAEFYNGLAKDQMKKQALKPNYQDLYYLRIDSPEG